MSVFNNASVSGLISSLAKVLDEGLGAGAAVTGSLAVVPAILATFAAASSAFFSAATASSAFFASIIASSFAFLAAALD